MCRFFYCTPLYQVSLSYLQYWRLYVLLGDFNSDFLFRGKTKEQIANGKGLKQIFSAYGLKNIVKEVTRICETTQTLIDLIAVSDTSKITSHGVAHLGISDHSFTYANLRMRKNKSNWKPKQ